MTPIDREKLSGLLDGELPPDEAETVRCALREDPALRREYEELAALDAQWKAEARAAAFTPRLTIPYRAKGVPMAALATILLLLRCLTKAIPPLDAGILEALVLAALIAWIIFPLLRSTDEDFRPITQRLM